MPTLSFAVGITMFEFHPLSVCLSVCSEHIAKMKDPKVLEVGMENDLEMSYGFMVENLPS